MQWLVLRRLLPQSGIWALATIASGAIGSIFASVVVALLIYITTLTVRGSVVGFFVAIIEFFLFVPMVGIVIGGTIGFIQWLVLRQRVNQANRWILTNAEGWAASLLVGFPLGSFAFLMLGLLNDEPGRATEPIIPFFTWVFAFVGFLMGGITGAISGDRLFFLLQQIPAPISKA